MVLIETETKLLHHVGDLFVVVVANFGLRI